MICMKEIKRENGCNFRNRSLQMNTNASNIRKTNSYPHYPLYLFTKLILEQIFTEMGHFLLTYL